MQSKSTTLNRMSYTRVVQHVTMSNVAHTEVKVRELIWRSWIIFCLYWKKLRFWCAKGVLHLWAIRDCGPPWKMFVLFYTTIVISSVLIQCIYRISLLNESLVNGLCIMQLCILLHLLALIRFLVDHEITTNYPGYFSLWLIQTDCF